MKSTYLISACALALAASATGAAAQTAPAAPPADTVTVTGERPDVVGEALADSDQAGETPGVAVTPLASPQAVPVGGGESVISYTPDYFAPFNPSNANDMVNRVPGFSADGGGNARGFGQNAGNVLINGERPSAKSQDSGDILQRIPVSEVVRIDLIRGQVQGIDMGGQTVVVNVIRRVSTRSSGTWRLQLNYNGSTDRMKPNGEVNGTFSLAGFNVTAGVTTNMFPAGQIRREYVLDPNNNALQYNEQRGVGGQDNWQATFNADRQIAGWALRLNGRYQSGGFGNDEGAYRIAGLSKPPGAGASVYPFNFLRYDYEQTAFDNNQEQWELGGDLERDLSEDVTLKLIVVQNHNSQTAENTFATYDVPTGLVFNASNNSENESGESILRAFVTWNVSSKFTIETGAEGAFNFLESTNNVTGLVASVTRVEEKRAEPYISLLYRAAPGLSFDASFQAEVSEISQSGFASRSRSFFYPKGAASMTWDVRDNTQYRLTIDRSVGQLNFGDFQRSVNLQENLASAGNPDLVPEQVWEITNVLEQRFWGDGVVTLEYSRGWIEDAQGQVPLPTATPGVFTEGPGNLGDADRWNVNLSADVPLERIGIPNARVNASYGYGDSEVVDPFTGEIRILTSGGGNNFFNNGGGGRRSFNIGFRKDFPNAGFSFGGNYFTGSASYGYRMTEITVDTQNYGGVEGFIETTRFFGVNIRLQVGQIGNVYSDRYRYRFTGNRATSPLGVVEWRRQPQEIGFNLRVRGSF